MINRKEFLTTAIPAFLLLANGRIVQATSFFKRSKPQLRFIVASDGHFGQPDTEYHSFFLQLTQRINEVHRQDPFHFCVINGDIIHDNTSLMPDAKKALDQLALPYYVTQGNHDHIDATGWEAIWKLPVNYDFSIDKHSCLLLTTSNEKGEYLCPDTRWLQQKLDEHRHQENIFIFMHINPAKLTTHGVQCDELEKIIAGNKRIRAIFNGHDHDEADIKQKGDINYIFDGHFGGSWGTKYRGFRVVELLENGDLFTYMLDPVHRIHERHLKPHLASTK